MKLDDFVFLAGNTARSKAYLQCMARAGLFPAKAVLYAEDKSGLYEAGESHDGAAGFFDRGEPLVRTLESGGIAYSIIENKDVNSSEIISALGSMKEKYVIYSGYGGAILREGLFDTGKKFLHVHAGKLPQYRGSTTAYYSMLDKSGISCTAIFLNERIDEGEIICSRQFPVSGSGVSIDYIYEPYARASVLVDALRKYCENGQRFNTQAQDGTDAETYFIIHPVLKHIALLGLEQE